MDISYNPHKEDVIITPESFSNIRMNIVPWDIFLVTICGYFVFKYLKDNWFIYKYDRERYKSVIISILGYRTLFGILVFFLPFSSNPFPSNIYAWEYFNGNGNEKVFFRSEIFDDFNNACSLIEKETGIIYDEDWGFYHNGGNDFDFHDISHSNYTFYKASYIEGARPIIHDYEKEISFLKKVFVYAPTSILERFLDTLVPSVLFIIIYMMVIKYKPKWMIRKLEGQE